MRTVIHVNGAAKEVDVDPAASLLSVLREELGLLATRFGCGQGQCGACAVLADGRSIFSCVTPVGDVGTRELTTVEGLAKDGVPSPVQQAFLDEDALQCGFCTSGMLVGATVLLADNPSPTEDEIRQGLAGHLCRCGIYNRVIRAVRRAAGEQP
jgi:aerobic-type carbon monoxide dehydrogenase small subunit (CoxS/CutS family)